MREAIDKAARELRNSSVFSACGTGNLVGYERVDSWRKAAKKAVASKWDNVKLEAQGDLSSELSLKFRERDREWNSHVVYIKKSILPSLMSDKIKPLTVSFGLDEELTDRLLNTIEDDHLRILIGAAYSDIVPSKLYLTMRELYLKGHFPCGWEGRYPEGKLIVF